LGVEGESGFSLVSPLKRTWSPRGQTPIIRTSIQHHERINLLGGLFVLPNGQHIKLTVKSYWYSLTGEEVIAFLKQILRCIPGHIVLVWDNHPIHKRRMVQDFLVTRDRLHVYHFPVAAPELNPIEFVWTQVSEYTAGTAPHNRSELQSNVFAGVARTRNSQNGC
jgi:transposase